MATVTTTTNKVAGGTRAKTITSPLLTTATAATAAAMTVRRPTQTTVIEIEIVPPPVTYISFVFGLVAGVVQAGVFNPYDRALYLSIKNNIPFLRRENFIHPYQGFFQSVGHRALSGGLYYPLEHYFLNKLHILSDDDNNNNNNTKKSGSGASRSNGIQSGTMRNFLAGTAAGSMNALIVNPVAAIKYKSWGRTVNNGMIHEMIGMIQKGGIRPFLNGLIPTVLRDLVFGGCYTFVRLEIQDSFQLTNKNQMIIANMTSAAIATIVSGPFNLARNIQYSTKSEHIAIPVLQVFTNLRHDTYQQPTFIAKCKHLQYQLRLGWGTLRVAMGMAFGHAVYDELYGLYNDEVDRKKC